MAENFHKGHRQRVKEKYLKDLSMKHFMDYEVLEFMLFYAYPMKDTKPIAKMLLNKYGTLHSLLNTDPKQMVKDGIVTENVAIYLSMFKTINKKACESLYDEDMVLNTFLKASNLMKSLMIEQSYESLYLVCLKKKKKVNAIEKINDGNYREVRTSVDYILKRALLSNAVFVIIGHNHPSGVCEPSANDYKFTKEIEHALKVINIRLLDHIIVSGDKSFSFAKNRCFEISS